MLNCFSNYGRFNSLFGAERHAIWNGAKDKPSAKPPTPEDQLAASRAELARLRASMGGPRAAGSAPATPPATPTYHTDQRDTREITVGDSGVPMPRYNETVDAAEKALALKGYLPPQEVVKIQNMHDHLYQQYMNPAFMLYLQRIKKFNAVYPSLELIFKKPYDFDYISLPNQRTEIHKRETSANADIRPDFLVVLETAQGHITEVNGHKLKNDTGGIPWMLQPEYNRQMPNWADRWTVEDERTGVPVTEEMKAIFMLNNVAFPKQFLALVDSRGFQFEKDDPLIADLRRAQAAQGTTYEEITQNKDTKWRVGVVQDPDPGNEGGYQIQIKTDSGDLRILHVSKESFIMQNASGSDDAPQWVQHPLYHNAVRWQYYEDAGAKATLTDAERTQMEAEKGQVKANKEELEKREKQREKRRKVDEALKTADFAKLKEAAYAVADLSDAKQKAGLESAKDTQEDKDFLKGGIKYYMDKNPANVDKVAGVLGVS